MSQYLAYIVGYSFVIIFLFGQPAELQLAYMVWQLLGLLFTGLVLFFTWDWLFSNRHQEGGVVGKIRYGFVLGFWLIFTAVTSFLACNSPAFVVPLVIVVILCFVKTRQYERLENETKKEGNVNQR